VFLKLFLHTEHPVMTTWGQMMFQRATGEREEPPRRAAGRHVIFKKENHKQ